MPKPRTIALIAAVSPAFMVFGAGASTAAGPLEFFENKVRPLLAAQCFDCHSAEAEAKGKLKAGLRMDSLQGLLKGGDSGAALTPGDPAKSRIVEAINYGNEEMSMPPGAKLDAAQIQILTEWVAMGAPWPDTGAAPAPAPNPGGEPYDWEKFRR